MNTQTIRVLEEVLEYSKKNPGIEIKFKCQDSDSRDSFSLQSPIDWEIVNYYFTHETAYKDEDSIINEINNSRFGETDDIESLDEARADGYKIDTVLIVRMGF